MAKRISKKQTIALLAAGLAKKRDDLKINDGDSTDYHLLEDGTVLLDFKSGARHSLLFDSEKECVDFFKKHAYSAEPSHILKGFPATAEGFMDLVDQSKYKLEELLKIENLDYSFGSLKLIDKRLKTEKKSYDYFMDTFYLWLIPYVSACVVNETFGEWNFVLNREANIIEPMILLPGGREINIFIDLSDEASENFRHFSTHLVSQLRLHSL